MLSTPKYVDIRGASSGYRFLGEEPGNDTGGTPQKAYTSGVEWTPICRSARTVGVTSPMPMLACSRRTT